MNTLDYLRWMGEDSVYVRSADLLTDVVVTDHYRNVIASFKDCTDAEADKIMASFPVKVGEIIGRVEHY